jgi:hypothetical protein
LDWIGEGDVRVELSLTARVEVVRHRAPSRLPVAVAIEVRLLHTCRSRWVSSGVSEGDQIQHVGTRFRGSDACGRRRGSKGVYVQLSSMYHRSTCECVAVLCSLLQKHTRSHRRSRVGPEMGRLSNAATSLHFTCHS